MVGLRQRHHERPRQPLERPAVLGAEARRAADDRGLRPAAAPRDRPGLDAHRLRVRPARRDAAGDAALVSGRGEAQPLARRRHPQVGRRRPLHRRQGDAPVQLLASTSSSPRRTSATSPRPSRPSPSRSATTPSGSTPARPAHRRPATSSTPAGSPRPTTWATSPTGPARSSSGTPAKMYVTNAPEAERFIRREYRKGWTLA